MSVERHRAQAASPCITITETPVLSTFVWVARVNARGVPSPPNSSFPGRQRAAGVHGVGRRSCDPEPRAGRAASRTHPSSPAGAPPLASRRLRRAQRRLVTPDLPLGPWRPGRGGERKGKALRRRASQALGVPARKRGGRACSARERSRATGRRLPTGVCGHVWALDTICVPLKTCAIVLLAFAVRAVGPSHLDSWPLLNNPQSARRAQVPRVSTSRAFGKEHAASGHPPCSPSVRGPAGDWVPAKSEEPRPFHSTQAAWPRLGGVL